MLLNGGVPVAQMRTHMAGDSAPLVKISIVVSVMRASTSWRIRREGTE
jgi:hypothetical protein